ncbi:MAG: hypothetical protein ABIO70_21545 [Pseudomonadota bacterium]
MPTPLLPLTLLAAGLISAPAQATVWRMDLSRADAGMVYPAAPNLAVPGSFGLALDLQVPGQAGCVRTVEREAGIVVRCRLAEPYATRSEDLGKGQVQPILFLNLDDVLRRRLGQRIGEAVGPVTFGSGGAPVRMSLTYDLHGSRFGQREMTVVLEAAGERVEARTTDRLSPANLAWALPTMPILGLGALILGPVDRAVTSDQVVLTLDRAAAELAQALAAHRPAASAGSHDGGSDGHAPPARAVTPPRSQAPPVAAAPPPPVVAAPPPTPRPILRPALPLGCVPLDAAGRASLTDDMMISFALLDEPALDAAAARLEASWPCCAASLDADAQAQLGRLEGLVAFSRGDEAGALSAFIQARVRQPEVDLPAQVAPAGGRLAGLWAQAGQLAFALRPPTPPPPNPTGQDHPLALAPPPAAPAISAPPARAAPPVTPRAPERPHRRGLWATAICTEVLAGGLYGSAFALRSGFDRSPTKGEFYLTNGAWYGAVGLGSLGLVVGLTAALGGVR